jgi:hypothetical protein
MAENKYKWRGVWISLGGRKLGWKLGWVVG